MHKSLSKDHEVCKWKKCWNDVVDLHSFLKNRKYWRVVRVVEGARLESVYTRKGIEGSNPSLSATTNKALSNPDLFVY